MIVQSKYINQEKTIINVTYEDGQVLSVPNAQGNRHYRELMEWVAAGNTIAPYVEPTPPPKTQFTPLEFMERFTDQEQLDLSGAALTDPQVKLFYDKMLAAKDIDLNDQRTQMGMALLVSKNLLSQARANQILTAE